MNTRKLRKAILTLCSALLLVSLSVGLTVAYLTDTATEVKNTFTAGNVDIDMDEADVDEYGEKLTYEGDDPDTTDKVEAEGDPLPRVQANVYKLIPGHTYTKDPTVEVQTGSEDCWLFVKLDNGLKDVIAATTIEDQMDANGWDLVPETTNVYAYEKVVSAGDKVVVFESFTLTGDVDVEANKSKEIVINAYAVQEDNFETALEALDAAKAPAGWLPDDWTAPEA